MVPLGPNYIKYKPCIRSGSLTGLSLKSVCEFPSRNSIPRCKEVQFGSTCTVSPIQNKPRGMLFTPLRKSWRTSSVPMNLPKSSLVNPTAIPGLERSPNGKAEDPSPHKLLSQSKLYTGNMNSQQVHKDPVDHS